MIGIHYFSRLVIVQVHYREMTSHDASSSLIADHLAIWRCWKENEHLNGLKLFFLANYYFGAWIVRKSRMRKDQQISSKIIGKTEV